MTALRPYREADLPALTALQRAADTAWFGAPEHDEDEVREWLALGDTQCVVLAGDRMLGAVNRWRTGSALLVDPHGDPAAALALLVPWLAEIGAPETDVLDRDEATRDAVTAAGWRHAYSSFDLLRPVADDWQRPRPTWPAGVTVRTLEPGEEPRLHRLIYDEAGWADVPGHHHRALEEWHRIFLDGRRDLERPLVAVEGDRPVGAALLRLFSDGTGWIAQLAVARDARGRGLGRSLLLAGLDRMVKAGATQLGLAVLAANRSALRLYEGVGLRIDREWRTFAPPGHSGEPPEELPAQTGGSA